MTIEEAKEYDRWWIQNSYKYKDGIPPYVLEAWQLLDIMPKTALVLNLAAVRKKFDYISYPTERPIDKPIVRNRRIKKGAKSKKANSRDRS